MNAGRAIEPAGREDSQYMIAVGSDDNSFELDEDALAAVLLQVDGNTGKT
jgi:hypothetical protein